MAAEHNELVHEMASLEKMNHLERVKQAKKRRAQQLKYYQQCEKKQDKNTKKKNQMVERVKSIKKLHFTPSILLFDAAIRNDLEEAENLLMSGVNPNVSGEDSLSVLHQCCLNDLLEMMKLFIRYGAEVNARDCDLWTPLHLAATCGNITLCQCLCENNADLLALNTDGNMPYDLCEDMATLDFIESEMAKKGITQELIDETRLASESQMLTDIIKYSGQGGDLNMKGNNGESLIHIAACSGYGRVIDFLIGKKVPVNVTDDEGWQALHMATYYGQYHVLESLLLAGADPEARTKGGETLLDLCDMEAHMKIEALLNDIKNRGPQKLNPTSTLERGSSSRRGSQAMIHTGRRGSIHNRTNIAHEDVLKEGEMLHKGILLTSEDDDDENETNSKSATQKMINIPEIEEEIVGYSLSRVPLLQIDLNKTPSKSILKQPEKTKSSTSSSNKQTITKEDIWSSSSSPLPQNSKVNPLKNTDLNSGKNDEKSSKDSKKDTNNGGAGNNNASKSPKSSNKTNNKPSPSTEKKVTSHNKTSQQQQPNNGTNNNNSSTGKKEKNTNIINQGGDGKQLNTDIARERSNSTNKNEQQQSTNGKTNLPSGTLADLKDQRRKQRDSGQKNGDVLTGQQQNNSTTAASIPTVRDSKKHRKFSNQNEVVDGSDNNNRCCIII